MSTCRRGVICGAEVSEYLLEKSRIMSQAVGERNYHVFYEMLWGLPDEELRTYGLTRPDDYFYLNQVREGGREGRCNYLSWLPVLN